MYAPLGHHPGEITSSLGQLGSLQRLHLGENQLSGECLKRTIVCGSGIDVQTTGNEASPDLVDVPCNCVSFTCGRDTCRNVGGICDVIHAPL